jgi:antitoxin VapB
MKTKATRYLDAEEAALLQASKRGDFRIKAATAADKAKMRRAATATLKRDKRVKVRMSSMDTAKLFSTGRGQAVRLPKQYRFQGDSVLIKRVGRAVVLLPRVASWDSLHEALALFEPGVRLVREQPARAERRRALRR